MWPEREAAPLVENVNDSPGGRRDGDQGCIFNEITAQRLRSKVLHLWRQILNGLLCGVESRLQRPAARCIFNFRGFPLARIWRLPETKISAPAQTMLGDCLVMDATVNFYAEAAGREIPRIFDQQLNFLQARKGLRRFGHQKPDWHAHDKNMMNQTKEPHPGSELVWPDLLLRRACIHGRRLDGACDQDGCRLPGAPKSN